ncbi:MAG: agmatinase [Nitrososphaerota archaeon]|nr:agmatinase [Nitrososphaerota archaeon]
MSGDWINFYFYKGPSFIGAAKSFEEAVYIAFGVPFDATASCRPGSRFAPLSLRMMSENLEIPEEELIKLIDLGDLPPTNSVEVMLRRVGAVVEEIMARGKVPVILGGEHTLTLASGLKVPKDVTLVIFDAHLDLRDEYMDTRVNHTTWLRRLNEEKRDLRTFVIGARAYLREELEYARENGIEIVTSREINENFHEIYERVSKIISGPEKVYLSIDVDVLDPGYAPGVGNPEPWGISPAHLFRLIKLVSGGELVGVDVVEVNPLFDNGESAANAVYAIYEALSASSTTSSRASR